MAESQRKNALAQRSQPLSRLYRQSPLSLRGLLDVTDIRTRSTGPRAPIATWVAPPDLLEGLTPNVHDVELDAVASDRLNVYVSASRGGVYVTAFEIATGFTPPARSQRIKTAGEAHSCAIRTSAKGKLLLVSDLSGGYRFFGL